MTSESWSQYSDTAVVTAASLIDEFRALGRQFNCRMIVPDMQSLGEDTCMQGIAELVFDENHQLEIIFNMNYPHLEVEFGQIYDVCALGEFQRFQVTKTSYADGEDGRLLSFEAMPTQRVFIHRYGPSQTDPETTQIQHDIIRMRWVDRVVTFQVSYSVLFCSVTTRALMWIRDHLREPSDARNERARRNKRDRRSLSPRSRKPLPERSRPSLRSTASSVIERGITQQISNLNIAVPEYQTEHPESEARQGRPGNREAQPFRCPEREIVQHLSSLNIADLGEEGAA